MSCIRAIDYGQYTFIMLHPSLPAPAPLAQGVRGYRFDLFEPSLSAAGKQSQHPVRHRASMSTERVGKFITWCRGSKLDEVGADQQRTFFLLSG